MDNTKIGRLITKLRKENNLTQLQLANMMHISDKTVSKWERGVGCPDVELLKNLSQIFGVNMEKLLSGELNENDKLNGNMRKMKFYICPECGNIITAMTETDIFCCGKKRKPEVLHESDDEEIFPVEISDNEFVITSKHEMHREHYITFGAFLTTDCMIIKKQYPEWEFIFRTPISQGVFIWHCVKHGLLYKNENVKRRDS